MPNGTNAHLYLLSKFSDNSKINVNNSLYLMSNGDNQSFQEHAVWQHGKLATLT
jgi:hypothetical protein